MNNPECSAAYVFAERIAALRLLWNRDEEAEAVATQAGEVIEMFGDLTNDELAVVGLSLMRMLAGVDTFGHLDLKRDRRDFAWEAMQEALDLCAWDAMYRLREYVLTPTRGDGAAASAPLSPSPLIGLEVGS